MRQAPPRAASGFSQVSEDIVALIELQWRLLLLDGQQAAQGALKAAIAGAIAGVFGLTAVVAVSFAAAWLIHQYGGLSVGWSLLIVAGCDMLISVLALGAAWMLGKQAAGSMNESVAELKENIQWVKAVLSNRDPARHPVRQQPNGAASQASASRF